MSRLNAGVRFAGVVADRWTDERLNRLEQDILNPWTKLSEIWMGVRRRAIPRDWIPELIRWVGYLRISRGYAQTSVEEYARMIGVFFAWMHAQGGTPATLTAQMFDRYLHECYIEKRHSPQMRAMWLNVVRGFYNWREAEGHGANPLKSLRRPKIPKRAARKYTTKQLRKMFCACDRSTLVGRRNFALLLMFYSTGARRMEMEQLRLQDLELRERSGAVRFHGKGAKERVVTFEGPAVDAMRAWLTDRDRLLSEGKIVDRDAVFVSLRKGKTGRALQADGMWQVIRWISEAAGIRDAGGDMGLHRMRSTYATDLYDAGHDLREIQRALGHEKIDTTMQYLAISNRQARVRLPASRVYQAIGEDRNEKPLWFLRKEKLRGIRTDTDDV